MNAARVIAIVPVFFAGLAANGAEPQIRVVTDGEKRPVAVEVVGWPKEELAALERRLDEGHLSQRLVVYVLDAKGAPQRPAIAGHYEILNDRVRFIPQFALRPGTSYEVNYFPNRTRSGDSPASVRFEIKIPAPPPAEPTRVTAIYPSASTLAENQLRFYVHFSAPMRAGEVYSHVKLLKADGTPVNRAFLEIGEELWDGSGQRITLLFDPGRVKKGLQPRAEFGPVLEAGQSYRLVIDKSWRDANGQPLAAGFEKRFTAGPAIETAVDSKQWKIAPPAAATRDPLVVRFSRPLDRALLMRMITVAGENTQALAGQITLGDDERRWEFRPDQPWPAGQFTLVVDTTLEDPAGNNLARPFEVDVFDQVDKDPAPDLVRIPFAIK